MVHNSETLANIGQFLDTTAKQIETNGYQQPLYERNGFQSQDRTGELLLYLVCSKLLKNTFLCKPTSFCFFQEPEMKIFLDLIALLKILDKV